MSKTTKFYNQVEPKWVCIDAQDRVLGRLASRIALILQGKNKATYSPNFLCGDIVVVINAEKIKLTGKKVKAKSYDKYTGYANGKKLLALKS
jgi:large subunit ribosomal protein L13